MKYFPDILSREESDELYERLDHHFKKFGFGFYAVDVLGEGKFIGFIGIQHIRFEADFTPGIEIGWRLSKMYWNMGLATEGAKKCLDFAFNNLGIEKIYSFAPHSNLPSLRIMEKIGMEKAGSFIHPLLPEDSELQPLILYQIEKKN